MKPLADAEMYLFKSVDEEIKIQPSSFTSLFDYFPVKYKHKT